MVLHFVCICVHGNQRSTLGVVPLELDTLDFETGSLIWDLMLGNWLNWLASESQVPSCLCLPWARITSMQHPAQQELYPPSHLPSPAFLFFPPPVRFNPNSVWQRHLRQAWRPGFDPWVLCGGKRELSSLGCPLIYMCPPHTHITRLQKKQDVPKHNFLRAGFSSSFSLYFLILIFYFIQGLTRCPWLAWNSL